MKRRSWVMATIFLVAVVGVGWWWRAHKAGAAPKYRTAAVDRGTIESVVSATGTIRPVVQVEVGSQVSGTVSHLFADYNSRVSKGQVIVQLEPSSLRARAVQAEAAVTRAEASVKDGERALARAQDLFKQSVLSQSDLDAASVTLELRNADLKQARAALQAARVDLEHTTIRAPIDGVVISRSVDLGQTVAASLQAPTLFTIANNLTQMQVETRIDEADIGQIRPGLGVTFTVDAFPDREFRGDVAQVRLEPIVDQNVVTYTTVIHTENLDLLLRPGMTANVTVKLQRRDDAFRVPNAALRFRPPATQGAGRGAMAASANGTDGRAGSGGPAGARGVQAATRDTSRGGAAQSGQRGGGNGAGGERRDGGAGGGDIAGRSLRRGGATDSAGTMFDAPQYRPGAIYVLRDGKPSRLPLFTGITDGAFTEVKGEGVAEGLQVVVGMDLAARAGQNLQPPPGMGGGGFRGGGGGGRPR